MVLYFENTINNITDVTWVILLIISINKYLNIIRNFKKTAYYFLQVHKKITKTSQLRNLNTQVSFALYYIYSEHTLNEINNLILSML